MIEQSSTDYGPLASRTTSAFPLSVATSLAFETLANGPNPTIDPERKSPPKVDLNKYKEIWINLATLYRNIVGAMPKESLLHLAPVELYKTIEFEIEVIRSVMSIECQNLCKPIFYYCTYKTPYTHQKHNAVLTRNDTTDGQKLYTTRLVETMAMFFRNNKGSEYLNLDYDIRPYGSPTALMLTHIPYDLLSHTHFSKLSLLESHTGVVKDRNLWYTKYYAVPGEELNSLPFIRKLLLIFGDKVMFRPMNIAFRRMILEISRNRHWTSFTTESKTIMDLDLDIKERYLFDMYKTL